MSDVSRTISILDAATGETDWVVEQDMLSGFVGPPDIHYDNDGHKMIAFGPQGKVLLVQRFGGGIVYTYDLLSGQRQNPLEQFASEPCWRFVVTPDGTRMVAITRDFLISWAVGAGNPKQLDNTPTKDGWLPWSPLIAISADGSLLAAAETLAVDIRRAVDGALVGSITYLKRGDFVRSVALSPDGKALAVVTDKCLRLYDVKTLQLHKLIPRYSSNATFSPDSKTLAVSTGRHLDLIEVASGRTTTRHLQHSGNITSVSYSPKGDVLAVGDTTGCVSVWNLVNGQLVWTAVPGTWGISRIIWGISRIIPEGLLFAWTAAWVAVYYLLWGRRKSVPIASDQPTP